MRSVRNWALPVVVSGTFVLLGFLLIGLPGVETVTTFNGTPTPNGISPEQMNDALAGRGHIDSFLDVYGMHLPGEPLFWMIGMLALMAAFGFRLGTKLKAAQKV